jgi:hypothetical protein
LIPIGCDVNRTTDINDTLMLTGISWSADLQRQIKPLMKEYRDIISPKFDQSLPKYFLYPWWKLTSANECGNWAICGSGDETVRQAYILNGNGI